ncbi:MAG: Gfo/Idh/MocA family oxidoreductase [Candidatus Latescibacterota bacterium]|nr:Gfo/Idh/MocA family oxidoreductase [Candidatus Latescibacterota bacterium]
MAITYRVAILGCRGRGTDAARAYHQHPRTEVVGLCDLLPERLQTLGDELEVSARYDDYHRMIEALGPDLVAIPTGTEFHFELSMGVLEHGVHIDVEKPMCQNLEEADRVVGHAARQQCRVAVHHQGRTGGAMTALRQVLDSGRIGEPRLLFGSGKGYYGGYGLMNIGTHMLNNMVGIAGHATSVMGTTLTDGRSATPEDVIPAASGMGFVTGEHITAHLQFAGNVSGVLMQHRFPRVDSVGHCLEVYGSEGRLFWRSSGAWWLPVPHDQPGDPERVWEKLPSVVPDSFDPEQPAAADDYCYAEEYVQALDEGRDHECSGVEGRHVMEIMMGIFESGALGTRIELPQADRSHPLLRWRQKHGLAEPNAMPRPYNEWLEAEDRRLGRN